MKESSQINYFYNNSSSPADFAHQYFDYLNKVLNKIDDKSLNKLFKEFEDARSKGKTIFVLGNGGSSTTATTMANDIGFDIIKKTGIDKPFKIHALTDNNAVITAISNDIGYEEVFLNQLKIHYRKGDKILLISASGNSENLILAAKWVKKQKGKIISFLGFDGGKLKKISDLNIHIDTNNGEYGPVEDCHLIINHVMAHWFQMYLKK